MTAAFRNGRRGIYGFTGGAAAEKRLHTARVYDIIYKVFRKGGAKTGDKMNAIELKDVHFSYSRDGSGEEAVKGVTLSIEEGSFVALVGHNGSGKSTLARLLNGLLTPTNGQVTVYGVDTRDEDRIFDVRSRVGMVFQNPDNQMIATNVADDIAFGPENLGVEREEIIRRVDWALSKVGMLEYKNGTPFKLSGGQKQRLAIAGVLAIKPRVMVLDEATAMLDPKGRDEVMAVTRQLNRDEGMTVVHITHYMDEALGADRLIVMNDGAIAADGSPKEVFAQYGLLRKIKLGVPFATNVAVALHSAGLDVDPHIATEEELLEQICRLK